MEAAPRDPRLPIPFSGDFQGLWEGRKQHHRFPGFLWTAIASALLRPPSALRGASQLLEQLPLDFQHSPRRIGIGEGRSDPFQRVHAQSIAQVLSWLVQRRQGFRRGLAALVTDTLAPFLVDLHAGLGARTMIARIRVQVFMVKVIDGVGVFGIDLSINDTFANDGAAFGLHQAVVAAFYGAALGLFDARLIEQPGGHPVD